jgi:Tfp pilus assembly protein PilN
MTPNEYERSKYALKITDENLIFRLLDGQCTEALLFGAADRIKKLAAQLKMVLEREAETQARHDSEVDALEAKLAKTVEALEDLADCVDDGCFCSEMKMGASVDKARATLAEIKGEPK